MIRITNGVITLSVAKSAFESMFKSAGFSVVKEVPSVETREDAAPCSIPPLNEEAEDGTPKETTYSDTATPEETSEEDSNSEERDFSEIPLSELGFDDLEEYADQLNIEHKGVRSKKELRSLIREHLKG